MPVRNGGTYFGPAVQSILAQTCQDFEFLIIDDGSTDGTPDKLARLAGEDSRIRPLQSGGSGIVAALNLGVAEAEGQYIARMDADDIALPNRFEVQVRYLEANPELVACGTAVTVIDADGKEMADGRLAHPAGEIAMTQILERNPFIHPTMMIRRDSMAQAEWYRNGCTYAEDYDLWLRLAETGSLANLAERTLMFRIHQGQTSRTKRLAQRAATALARQTALRRTNGQDEGADMSLLLAPAVRQFLQTRANENTPLTQTEARDLLIMSRFAQQQFGRSGVSMIERRIKKETNMPKAWLLPAWYLFDRLKT